MLPGDDAGALTDKLDELRTPAAGDTRPAWLRTGILKSFADGVVEARTAAIAGKSGAQLGGSRRNCVRTARSTTKPRTHRASITCAMNRCERARPPGTPSVDAARRTYAVGEPLEFRLGGDQVFVALRLVDIGCRVRVEMQGEFGSLAFHGVDRLYVARAARGLRKRSSNAHAMD